MSAVLLLQAGASPAAAGDDPALTSSPEGMTILRIEEQRAPTPQDVQILLDLTRAPARWIQNAAIRALGRLERRDVITALLPLLAAPRADARREAATAIGQAMRGEPLPLDPDDTQLDGVQQALLTAAYAEKNPIALGEIARTLARLPYRRAEQAVKTDALLRQILELERQVDSAAAGGARPRAAAGVELMARLHGKLFPVPEETLNALREIATASAANVKRSDVVLRVPAMQALVSAGGVDVQTLRALINDNLSADLRRLAMLSLSSGGAPVTGGDRLDYLRQGFRDRETSVRYEALRGYVRLHAKADGCQPIMDMLLDTDEHVVLYALDSLGNCPGDEHVVNRLIGEARTPPNTGSWRRESHALVSLAKLSPEHAKIPLHSHMRHTAWQVRMYAVRAAAAADLVETLEQLAYDPHDNVREATLMPLRRLKQNASAEYFAAALDRNDYQLLRTAAREMAGLNVAPGLTAALVNAVMRVTDQKRDTSRDTRIALLQRLREFGSDRWVETLLPLLKDIDPKVAAEAATTLSAWTGRTYTIDPQPLPPQEIPSAAELAICTQKVAYLVMDSGQEIGIRLDPIRAPLMSTRFLRLVNRNYFDGLTFHRVVSNFIVQGGSPGANEYVGDGPYVKDEISERSHNRGTVGLSTRGRDTGDAQFFINLVNNPRLDFEYTVFGGVLPEHLDRIDKIQEGDRIVNVVFRTPFGRSR